MNSGLITRCRDTAHARCAVYLCFLLAAGCRTEPEPEPLPETEIWGVLYIDGKKVGYQHFQRKHVKTDRGLRIRVESTEELRIRRFGSETVMRVEQVATETRDGVLIDFESRLKSGATTQETTGEVRDGKLHIQQGEGPPTIVPLPTGPVGSFAAVDNSLARKPLKPGEKRKVLHVVPMLGGVATVEMEAKDWESTDLLSGEFQALRIEGEMQMPGGVSLPITIWTDNQGDALKAIFSLGGLKQTVYRTTKAVALAPGDYKFDLGRATTVPVKRNIAGIHEKQKIRYRLRLKVDADGNAFASGTGQSVKTIDARTFEITVVAARPGNDSGAATSQSKPTAAERAPNQLIESDDAAVKRMAEKAAGSEKDPWAVAKKLEQHVHQAIRSKNFSSAFDSAATVAKTLSGDCTEHAVLLAAVARAKKIPGRMAVGLVYMEGSNAFGMHAWTEVWIDDRWIGLDATLGRGGLGPGHIKIAHTSLDGPGAYSSLLPVARWLGQMEIEVLEVE
jgi:hypothetical protein